jgi:hypothetical protein
MRGASYLFAPLPFAGFCDRAAGGLGRSIRFPFWPSIAPITLSPFFGFRSVIGPSSVVLP